MRTRHAKKGALVGKNQLCKGGKGVVAKGLDVKRTMLVTRETSHRSRGLLKARAFSNRNACGHKHASFDCSQSIYVLCMSECICMVSHGSQERVAWMGIPADVQHTHHVCHPRDIPVVNVGIEGFLVDENCIHVCHARNVPCANFSVL